MSEVYTVNSNENFQEGVSYGYNGNKYSLTYFEWNNQYIFLFDDSSQDFRYTSYNMSKIEAI